MKKAVICMILLIFMLTCVLPAYAAEPELEVLVRPSQATVQVGDTVEFTVLATGSGVTAMQFQLQLPEGLQYVPDSGATPKDLAQKLGVPAAEWTEQSMMFTFYNDVCLTFAEETELLHFSCVAQKEGNWDVVLFELFPFDENFEEFPAKLQVQTVKVAAGEIDAPVSGEIDIPVSDETEPPVSNETKPPVFDETNPSVPDETNSVQDPENSVQTEEVTVPEEEAPMELPTDGEPPEWTTGSVSGKDPQAPKEPQLLWLWIGMGGGAAAVAVVVIVILKKKKHV